MNGWSSRCVSVRIVWIVGDVGIVRVVGDVRIVWIVGDIRIVRVVRIVGIVGKLIIVVSEQKGVSRDNVGRRLCL